MENWPSELQQLLSASNFTYVPGVTTIRSEMDIGPAKVRSRFTDAVDTYKASIFIDIDDIDTLQTFYKTLLNNGTDPFYFDDPFTGDQGTFRFVEPPSIQAIGGRMFEVSLNWEKLP